MEKKVGGTSGLLLACQPRKESSFSSSQSSRWSDSSSLSRTDQVKIGIKAVRRWAISEKGGEIAALQVIDANLKKSIGLVLLSKTIGL